MLIDKTQVVDLIRARDGEQKADLADRELPAWINTDEHGPLLSQYGLDPHELIDKFRD